MAEELQSLIDRIQKDGVERAEAEAGVILAKAKAHAAELVKAAEAKASALLKKADEDSKQFAERGARTLEQSARNVILAAGQALAEIARNLLGKAVDESLDANALKTLIETMVAAFAAKGMSENRVEILLSPADRKLLDSVFVEKLRKELGAGIELKSDERMKKGFAMRMAGGQVAVDCSREAIAEAMADFLRPRLSEIVHRAARAMDKEAGKK